MFVERVETQDLEKIQSNFATNSDADVQMQS